MPDAPPAAPVTDSGAPVAPPAVVVAPAAWRLPSPWVVCAAVAAVAALVAVLQLGRLHPDEVYQFLEPAWFKVHGYGVLAWEWQTGLRNWAAPLFFSLLLRLAGLLGMENPRLYRGLIEVPQFVLHAWMLLAVYRYAARRVGGTWAYGAVLLVGLYGVVVSFAGRTLGESFSAAFFIVGVEALDRKDGPWRSGAIGGLAMGLAVVARYGSAVLVAAAMVWLLAMAVVRSVRKDEVGAAWKQFVAASVAGLVVAGALGLLDQLTWHQFFHSFRAYAEFNVFTDSAARHFGAEPATYYLPAIFGYPPVWVWPGLVWAVWKQRPRVSLPLFTGVAYVLVVTFLTAHKEQRFLYPALVCLAVAAAPGVLAALAALKDGWPRRALAALALVASLASLFVPGELRAVRGDQFRAIVEATRPAEVNGLLVVNDGIWGAGGFFYIGKKIPWLTADTPKDYNFQAAVRDPHFNRVVSFDGRAVPELEQLGFRVIDQIGEETVLAR